MTFQIKMRPVKNKEIEFTIYADTIEQLKFALDVIVAAHPTRQRN